VAGEPTAVLLSGLRALPSFPQQTDLASAIAWVRTNCTQIDEAKLSELPVNPSQPDDKTPSGKKIAPAPCSGPKK